MFDEQGRVWITSRIRPTGQPGVLQGRLEPSFGEVLFPLKRSGRQLAVYDPKTKQVTLIDTCFGTHHLEFAEDANNTLWTSSGGGGGAVGWLNTKMFDETHDEEKSQGWTALILDTNGNGKRDEYVEPESARGSRQGQADQRRFLRRHCEPGGRLDLGNGPGIPGRGRSVEPGIESRRRQLLRKSTNCHGTIQRRRFRASRRAALDIDRNGVVWTVLASGHFASFDRRKCKGPLNGPTATGQHCPEGWTLYPLPGPQLRELRDPGSAEASYYDWVDQFDTFGLGKNVPIATGNGNDALLALLPDSGKFVVLRVPYPMGFYVGIR